jgi:hypothetical protein
LAISTIGPSRPTAALSSGHHRPAKNRLRAGKRRQPGGDLAAREAFDHRERALARRQRGEHHALQGLIVLRQDEVAEAPAHLRLHRRELALDVRHVGAAHRELGLELGIMRAEPELDAAVDHQDFQS